VTADPVYRGQLHVDADTRISCRPVSGHAVSVMSLGRHFDVFATRADLARIADAIAAYLHPAPVRELTVEPDPAEAERFRLECERDLKGEDE
jgi:hypothetical protein